MHVLDPFWQFWSHSHITVQICFQETEDTTNQQIIPYAEADIKSKKKKNNDDKQQKVIIYVSNQLNNDYCTICTYKYVIHIGRYTGLYVHVHVHHHVLQYGYQVALCLLCLDMHTYVIPKVPIYVVKKQSSNYILNSLGYLVEIRTRSNYSNSLVEILTMSFKFHFIQFSCLCLL